MDLIASQRRASCIVNMHMHTIIFTSCHIYELHVMRHYMDMILKVVLVCQDLDWLRSVSSSRLFSHHVTSEHYLLRVVMHISKAKRHT